MKTQRTVAFLALSAWVDRYKMKILCKGGSTCRSARDPMRNNTSAIVAKLTHRNDVERENEETEKQRENEERDREGDGVGERAAHRVGTQG